MHATNRALKDPEQGEREAEAGNEILHLPAKGILETRVGKRPQ
jgi:hypothetical protein